MLWTTLKIALGSLSANKLRSVLTMLGVIIGVGAVIAMLSLGSEFGTYISEQISWLGTNVLFVRAGHHRHGPMSMVHSLTPGDAEALLEVPGVSAVSPLAFNSAPIKAGNRSTTTAMISGVAPSYVNIQNVQIERGRMFTDSEVRRQARVAVMGPKTARDLLPGRDPVGRIIRVRGINFRVIGLTGSIGDKGGFNPDDRIFIPYTTAMKQIPPRRDHLELIAVTTADESAMKDVTERIRHVLRRRHRLRPGEGDDFTVQNLAEVLATFNAVSLGLTLFLGTVAAISLIVGGIGIMNIMLATVAERTREIGIRKALGAKDRDVLWQFLIEALVITLSGGLLGLALGWGLMTLAASIIHQWLKLEPTLQWWVVGMSIAIATTVGLASGLYPAYRASQLDPIRALRYE
jgi:putative ABC transport system permease protein